MLSVLAMVVAFVQSHWLAIVAVASVVATVVNTRLPKDASGNVVPPSNWLVFVWRVVCDLLAWSAQPGKVGLVGSVNLPGLPSRKARPGVGPALVLLLAFGATACGSVLVRCELGKLPQTLQSVVAAISAIASQPNGYVLDLVALGETVGPGQVDCVAQAIIDATTAKKGEKLELAAWAAEMQAHLKEYLEYRKSKGVSLKCGPLRLSRLAIQKATWLADVSSYDEMLDAGTL